MLGSVRHAPRGRHPHSKVHLGKLAQANRPQAAAPACSSNSGPGQIACSRCRAFEVDFCQQWR
eukprot:7490330-Lingulodinium_polyedra.AAC.1